MIAAPFRRLIGPLVGALLAAAGPVAAAEVENDAALCARTARDGNVAACAAAVAADPAGLDVLRNLAFAYLAVDDQEACLAVHRAIVALAPDDAEAWFGYAAAAATFWDYRAAVEPIRRALLLAPDHRLALRVAVLVFRASGETRDALAALAHGAELGDDVMMAGLAEAYAQGIGTAADPAAARLWLARAAALGHVGAMEQLAALYRRGAPGVPADPAAASSWAERARLATQE
jgi:TPR repeat protein